MICLGLIQNYCIIYNFINNCVSAVNKSDKGIELLRNHLRLQNLTLPNFRSHVRL